jgi:hypothetical protein
MANYPGAIDSAASMYTPVDASSAKPLETTTTGGVLAGDSTINVASTTGGFAATYGILSIDDELIVYTGKTGAQFTGCQRGVFGTAAAGHGNGVAVKANMVAGFITALQSAVLAIENEIGTTAARNYVGKDGAVTVTGLKTFQDGAEFGAGTKSNTGLVRLPNAGAVKWRKQDNSGDLGIALNASNHLAMDAIIDFAAGQTFGASTVPDATTLAKGIVQIDPVGGISVAAGVISLSASGVGPGTYTKVTVDVWGRATAGTTLAAGDLPAHTHTASDIVSGALPFAIQNNGAAVGTRRALNLIQGANIGLTFLDVPASDRVNVTVALASVPAHVHAEADVTNLVTDLAGKAALSHTHTSSQITDATAAATPAMLVLRDGDGGANFAYAAANNLWAFQDSHFQSIECGAFGTVGGPYENMAKYSEDFSVGTWDKNGGSCSVSVNAAAAPDGNSTADQIAASTVTPVLQQNVAGLVDGATYTFYVWGKVASGTKNVSIAIVNSAYGAYLAGPAQVTLTATWQRFKITGTLAGGQTGLWVVVRQFDGNGDTWTTGNILLWGACLQQGTDPKKAYARTWGYQTGPVAAGVACGPVVVSATNSTDSPFKVRGPGSPLADHTLLEVTAGGELIIAGGTGNGYRLAEIVGASNPSGWSGCLKVKNPAGVTAGYILLYSNP